MLVLKFATFLLFEIVGIDGEKFSMRFYRKLNSFEVLLIAIYHISIILKFEI